MAFKLEVIAGSTTVNLSDGNPFRLRSARGLSGASIRRVTVAGPTQTGDTDVGYRLNPREVELVLGFHATTDAVLDGYRDTLNSVFKPLPSTPVQLRVTRDDGGIRQLDCYRVGDIQLTLLPTHRVSHYHEATVRLRAADPAFYDPTPGTASATGTAIFETNWWLAGGAIGTAQVLMSGGTPSTGANWSYTGTIPVTQSWTLAIRNGGTPSSGQSWLFRITDTSGGIDAHDASFARAASSANEYRLGADLDFPPLGSAAILPGTHNYFYCYDPEGVSIDGVRDPVNRTAWIAPTFTYTTVVPYQIRGTPRQWRVTSSGTWSPAVPKYALYSPCLNEAQRTALNVYMSGGTIVGGDSGTVSQVVNVPYEGDLPEFPVITVTGPIASPRIVNTATGEKLDFGTVTIGAGTSYVIDTRYGYKTVLQGTVSRKDRLTADSDLGTWHLAPSPVANGGVNSIAVYGSAIGSATSVRIVYYNRYSSF